MADITVTESNSVCTVTVSEGSSKTSHRVTVPDALYQQLTGGTMSKADCVKAAFQFLLERESKESILRQFDLPVISRYFPEFEREFPKYV